jgi:hypothetical protein
VLDPPSTIAPNGVDQVDTSMISMLWSRVEGATSYDIQVTSKSSFANPDVELFGLANPFCDVSSLRPGTTYRWRVIGYSDTSVGRWSDTATFTTRARFDQSLVPLTPEREALDVPLRGVFRFSTSPVYVEYEAQVSSDPFFTTIEHAFRSLADTVEYYGLAPGTLYYWRVVGFLTGRQSESGLISSFTTTTSTGIADGSEGDARIVKTRDGLLVLVANGEANGVVVFDILGRQVFQQISGGRPHTIFIPQGSLPRGCYLLEIQRDGKKTGRIHSICE